MRNLGLLVLVGLLAHVCGARASDPSQLEKLASTRDWQVLLHYKKNFWGHVISEADGPGFFLDPDGNHDPLKELQTDLRAIEEGWIVGPNHQHFQCAFPERSRFLKTALNLAVPDVDCPNLKTWKSRFEAESVTAVFATAYLGNVASSFGHSFLRINSKAAAKERAELVDFGLSYAAKSEPKDNAITFAFKGLFGGYEDALTMQPYFKQVAEYHDIENRDIWEYELNLSAEQVDRLLNHVWELDNSFFKYYFANKNCSYHLLALLEVANPDWHLTDGFAYWAIPGDGFKALREAGAVRRIHFRPSIYHKLKQKISMMTPAEKKQFESARKNDLRLAGGESALAIESLLDYQWFTIRPAYRELTPKEKQQQNDLFLALAEAPAPQSATPPPPLNAENQPDLGVGSKKISVYAGGTPNERFAGIIYRATYHDLLDPDLGYTPFSEVVGGQLDLRYTTQEEARNPRLQQFDIVDIVSLTPVDSLHDRLSWSVALGTFTPPDVTCQNCLAGRFNAGGGLSAYLLPDYLLIYVLLKANVEYGDAFSSKFRLGPSIASELLARLSARAKLRFGGEYFQYSDGSQGFGRLSSQASWLVGHRLEIRGGLNYDMTSVAHTVSGNLSAGLFF